ncbi:breast cancer type 2 susceptibility protein homolog [Anopheles nili]|uniref:breast cancer type 2 susceptibility protein homolog n=1 Tax=Anopheles nili TaxID=185578 RepID=UPI00237A53A9|nr:breast cancer type 2 susceptibility protein homolog [Anopheles nili]
MDEVPVSPVQRKRKKFRRKLSCTLGRTSKTPGDLSNTEESFQQSVHCSSIQRPVQDDNGERKQPSFYFDDCSENIETVTANPLASAILLEKASVVAIPSKVPSEDFIFNSNQDFITVGELAKRTGADRCIESAPGEASQNVVSNPVSYNFTQFEVDTQLLGIFDAAAQLSACDSNSSCDRTLVQAILDDFRLEDAETCSMEVDFSIIKTEGLRRRLIQMQHLINSPPKTVKRQKDCRQYGNVKRNPKQSIARRLSYDTDSNSSAVGQPASDDETTSPTEGIANNESDDETSMDCVALNTSVYIQANLTQLSAFFSQSPTALNDSSEEKKGNEVNSQSIDQEPSFHGFASPISLASEVEHSPKTERMYFYTFDESDGENRCHSSDDETSPPMAEPVVMEHLLEDDEDLLMLAQHVEEKARDSLRKPVERMHRSYSTALGSSVNTSGMTRSVAVAEQFEIMTEKKVEFLNLHPFAGGFSTARGKSIAVSEKALARAQNMLAEEEEKIREENTFGNFIVGKDQPFTGGFSTARGSSIAISAKALAKAKQMLSEEEAKLEKESGMISNSHLMEGTRCTYNAVTPSVRKDAWIENKRNDGTETSFSGNKSITVDAPITAQKPFDEEETKENISNIVPINTVRGFSTARGKSIAVSAKALERAQNMLAEEEEKIRTKNEDQPFTGGFSTARGSSIAISAKALEKAKQILSEEEAKFEKENDRFLKECETLRKRKISFSQDELVVTPTKKLRTHLQLSEMALQSSTPSAVKVEIKEEVSSDVTTSKPATTCAVEEFFAQLDDHEFQELFSDHRPQNVTEVGKKQNKLLEKFEQCSDAPPVKPAFKSSDFDDSFSEISTNVSMAEAQHPHVPDEVQIKRIQELEKQRQLIESKPEEACRPRVCDFTCRKQQKNRNDLQKTLGGKPPKLAQTSNSSMGITQTNVMQFRFRMADYYGESFCQTNTSGISIGLDGVDGCLIMDRNSTVGVEEMKIGFLASPGVDPRLVPPGWIENAWRWIVIKLSAYERNCREHLSGSLTPENVLAQLHHRYHVEIDAARRPAMRKILEKDDVPSRRMVLFVSNIYHGNGPIGTELELSDGWYSLRTVIDVPLASAVRSGKIFIGMKLMVQGAELLNHNDACGPLEVPPDVRLKITANSSRRARWYAKLGYCRHPMPVPFACNSILAEGGLIVLFRAIVIRSYPMLYLESFADKAQKSIMRSERLQLRYSRKSDASQLEKLHKLYNQVQHDIEKERAAERLTRNMRVTTSTTSEELQEYLENGLDLSFVDIDLTPTQQHVIERFQQQRQQELEREINRRVKALLEKDAIRPKVSSLLKVRLIDSVQPERSYLLSIWRPSEEVCSVLQEEAFIEFGNVAATGMKTDDAIQLTANGDNCTYKRLTRGPESVPPQVPFARTITSIDAIDPASFRPAFGEFDTIGVVVQIVTNESATGQSVYLADTAMNLLCVRFNPNLAGFAYDDVVQEQAVLYVTNLQWRTRSCHTLGVPHCFATYFTTCVVKPVHGRARSEWDRFQVQLEAIDREDFFRRCQEKVGDLPNTSGVSSAGNITPNASGSGTPFRQQTLVVGLQHSTPIGTGVSAMKRKINRLASMYGSPPKLSPIAVRRNPVLTKGFKTPGRLEDQT